MAFAYFDRVKESSTTTGVGVFTLAGAYSGFRAFSSVFANGDNCHYVIYQPSSGAWEVGYGTWLTGNQLQRATVLASSNANALVSFTSGTKEIWLTEPAAIPSLQGAAFFSVADVTARDAIPAVTLRTGALCRLISTGIFYAWNGSAWVLFQGFMPTVGVSGSTLVSNGTSWVAGPLDLSDADSHTGILDIASGGTGLSSAGGVANRALVTTNGTSWLAGLIDLATMVTGTLAVGALATAVSVSVLGRSAGTAGARADIQASADGQSLRMAGGALSFGAVDLADADAVTGLLPHTNLANGSALSVLGRSVNSAGAMSPIAGSADQALVVNTAGTALAFGQIQTGGIATSAITLPKLANGSASSVLGRSAATGGAYADIASSVDGQVFRRGAAGVLGWGAVDLADADAVTGLLPFANFANGSATSVFARASGTSGVMASLAATVDGQFLQRTGGALVWAGLTAGSIGGGSAVGQVLINTIGNVPAWGAVDLADSDAVTGLLQFSNLANLTGLSVLGRSVVGAGVMAAITGAADQALVVNTAGTALSFGQIQTGGIATSAITLPKLANATASSVLGRSAATSGAYADIAASAVGQVLRVTAGSVVSFGAVDLADADAVSGLLPFTNFANGSALSVFGRSVNSAGAMASIAGAASQVLQVNAAGTALLFAALDPATITNGSLPVAKLANSAAASVLGRSAATTGAYADITSSADGQTLRRAAGVLGWGALDLADADAVTGLLPFANLASLAGLSVFGRSASSAGVMAAMTGTANQALRVDAGGTTLGFGQLATGAYTDASVTLAKLANGTAASVLGRSAATGGVYADIASSADGQTLVRTAGVVGWGALDLADADAVTGLLSFANMTSLAGMSVLGRATNSAGVMAAITGTANQVLRVNAGGTALGFGQVAVAALTNAAASSVLGRSAATGGVYADITSSADGQVLRRGAAGVLAWGALDLADADAVTGLLPGTNVAPNFGSQNIVSTGTLTIGAGTNAITAAGSNFRWSPTVLTPAIFQDDTAVLNAIGQSLTIAAQSSTNGITVGGDLILEAGNGTAASGALRFYLGTLEAMRLEPFGVGLTLAIGNVQFLANAPGPTITQTNGVTASATGEALTIGAQNMTGATSTGGPLILKSGTGTSKAGPVTLQVGSTVMLQANDLGSGREVLSLGGAVSTTEMPANTGDKVIYIPFSTTPPTTGVPVNGFEIYGDATGFYVKGPSGTSTQLAAA